MKSKNEDDIWIAKIADSKHFTSEKDAKLLQYLITSTREGKSLKENVIAIDVFHRDTSFDSGSDSIVRSSIYNLRKKLDSYYQLEGNSDPVRFIIPKGSYKVEFKTNPESKNGFIKNLADKDSSIFKWLFGITLSFSILFAFLYLSNNDVETNEPTVEVNNPVWSHFIESPNPLIIVLGDYFMMQKTQYPDSSLNFIRDPEINSQNDLASFLEKNPNQKESLKKLGQSYFGEEIPECLFEVNRMMMASDKQAKMKYSSQLTLSDIRENDIIFIGDFGTLGTLNPFFMKPGIRYSTMPPGIVILNEKQDTLESITMNNPNQSIFENDYTVVSSIEAYEGKKILFFTSFLPFGKKEALYKLGEMSFLSEITDSLSAFSNEWNLLMKISGLKSTGFYYEIIRFDHVEK